MTTLTELRIQVLTLLQDIGLYVFTNDEIDQALRMALLDYSESSPLIKSSILDVDIAGNEVDLSTLPNIRNIERVYYPWDTTVGIDEQDPNTILRWELINDAGSAKAFVVSTQSIEADTCIRVHYTAPHTIGGLLTATDTTIPVYHYDLIVRGAAGYALASGAADRTELLDKNLMLKLSNLYLVQFTMMCNDLAAARFRAGAVMKWAHMDKHDRVY